MIPFLEKKVREGEGKATRRKRSSRRAAVLNRVIWLAKQILRGYLAEESERQMV